MQHERPRGRVKSPAVAAMPATAACARGGGASGVAIGCGGVERVPLRVRPQERPRDYGRRELRPTAFEAHHEHRATHPSA